MFPTSRSSDDTTVRHHHCRQHYCQAILPGALAPTKLATRFLYAWADSVLHEETYFAFVAAYPDEFPVTLASATEAELSL